MDKFLIHQNFQKPLKEKCVQNTFDLTQNCMKISTKTNITSKKRKLDSVLITPSIIHDDWNNLNTNTFTCSDLTRISSSKEKSSGWKSFGRKYPSKKNKDKVCQSNKENKSVISLIDDNNDHLDSVFIDGRI